jgi:hypothetical protein
MSNFENEADKLQSHLEELTRKHRELDTELEVKYNNMDITPEVRRLKTMKLYLKDEIHRIISKLEAIK